MAYYVLAAILVVLDQAVKRWTVANIELGEVVPVIDNVFSLTYVRNTGAAWSILEGQMWFFYLVTIIVAGVCIYGIQNYAKDSRLIGLSLAFLLGGALGNFIDRLFLKYVVDMFKLEFIDFPIFNVADVALNIGVILMVIHLIFEDSGAE